MKSSPSNEASTEGKKSRQNFQRRQFLQGTAAVTAFTIVPRYVLGGQDQTPPSDLINVAVIGTGGQGIVNMKALLQEKDVRIIAIADPNEEADYSKWYYGGKAGRLPALKLINDTYQKQNAENFKGCADYIDFREMLEKEKAIDAVLVATPDHAHGVVTMAALKLKKHVYCEKPLCRSLYETWKVIEAAREAKVATQMGNYGHSGEGLRLFCEWIWDGAIGPVREVHAWANFPPMNEQKERPTETPEVPKGMNWDLWLGPAQERPYHPAYAPVTWRAWHDFGVGMLGDFACHHMDPAFQALKLGYPTSIEACSFGGGKETFPYASLAYFDFPAREEMPPVRLTWYDGGLGPETPEELEPNRKLSKTGHGILLVGDKGKILGGGWAQSPRLIPETAMQAYKRPPKTLPRVPGHHRDWLNAIKNGGQPSANFDNVGKMVEAILMGAIAERVGEKLYWDSAQLRFTNSTAANDLIKPNFREGWAI
jgi:predicted dehydrogenase